jgi:hypothetical protein
MNSSDLLKLDPVLSTSLLDDPGIGELGCGCLNGSGCGSGGSCLCGTDNGCGGGPKKY